MPSFTAVAPGGKLAGAAHGQPLGKAEADSFPRISLYPLHSLAGPQDVPTPVFPRPSILRGWGREEETLWPRKPSVDHSALPKCPTWTQNSDLLGLSGVFPVWHIGSHG